MSNSFISRKAEEEVRLVPNGNGMVRELSEPDRRALAQYLSNMDPSESFSSELVTWVDAERPLQESGDYAVRMELMAKRDRHPGKQFRINPVFPQEFSGDWTLWTIDEGQAAALGGLVEALHPVVVLETGTNKGRSTRAIAEALHRNEHCGKGMLYTIDMVDFAIRDTGAITQELSPFVTALKGKTPEAFTAEPLASLQGIEFAFLDGDHTAEGLQKELEYVESHRADKCTVAVDNTRDDYWSGLEEFFKGYKDHPFVNLPTQTGMVIIQMEE